jgi:hypothetical protein
MARLTWMEPALIDLNTIAEYITLDDLGGGVEARPAATLPQNPGAGGRVSMGEAKWSHANEGA